MEVRFEDEDLARVEAGTATAGHGKQVDELFRRRMLFVREAPDERDFYALKSLNFEKRQGDERSIRLNLQWRLFLRFEGKRPRKVVVIVRIADEH